MIKFQAGPWCDSSNRFGSFLTTGFSKSAGKKPAIHSWLVSRISPPPFFVLSLKGLEDGVNMPRLRYGASAKVGSKLKKQQPLYNKSKYSNTYSGDLGGRDFETYLVEEFWVSGEGINKSEKVVATRPYTYLNLLRVARCEW